MNKLGLVFAPVLVVMLGYFWQLNQRLERLSSNVTELAESLRKKQDASLGEAKAPREVRIVQVPTEAPKEAVEALKPPLAVPSTALPPDLDPVVLRRRADENAVHLEQAVYAEPADPEWGQKARREIERLDGLFPGSSVRRAECRKTMCFIDVVHDDQAALMLWDSRTPFETSDAEFSKRLTIRFPEPDGKVSARIFVVRNGYELPAID